MNFEVERHGAIKQRKSRSDIKIRKKIQKKKARNKDEEKALSLRRIQGTFKKPPTQISPNSSTNGKDGVQHSHIAVIYPNFLHGRAAKEFQQRIQHAM